MLLFFHTFPVFILYHICKVQYILIGTLVQTLTNNVVINAEISIFVHISHLWLYHYMAYNHRTKSTNTQAYFVSLVLRERILTGVLVYASSNAEAKDQIISLSQLLDLNSLLFDRKKKKNALNTTKKHILLQRYFGSRSECALIL